MPRQLRDVQNLAGTSLQHSLSRNTTLGNMLLHQVCEGVVYEYVLGFTHIHHMLGSVSIIYQTIQTI